MKRLLFVLTLATAAATLPAATSTNEVPFTMLKVAPEKYRGKLIIYADVYRGIEATLPYYMEVRGFKSDRCMVLTVGDPGLPVIVKKKDDIMEIVSKLREGLKVRVTGRIREFKADSRLIGTPKYYVDADTIITDEEKVVVKPAGVPAPPPPVHRPQREVAPPPF
jgi:hypothetical protein